MIKGIDAQIMMQRATDYSKIASEQLSSLEHAKEFAQKLEQERANHLNVSVSQLEKALKKDVHKEKNDDGKKKKHGHGSIDDEDFGETEGIREEDEYDIFNSKNEMLPESKLKVMPSRELGVSIDIDA